jgi:UDPglucose 6-dehydrogenase
MNIAVIGGGYVGLVMAAGLAELGHPVVCAEHDPEKLKLIVLEKKSFSN